MALPLTYNLRNVFVRWRATLATVLGVALVVAVYLLVQSLAVGLEKSSQNTGDPRNVMIVRKGSTAESSSQVSREALKMIQYLPQIARDELGRPLISGDVLVLINLPRLENNGEANVLMRGVSPMGLQLRPQVTLTNGHWFTPGQREVVVSRRLAARFAHFQIGDKFKTGGKELTVAGWFDGHSSAFDSEVWMDADEARSVFDRENYSSMLVRVTDAAAAEALAGRVETDRRLTLRAIPELKYYSAQTMTATPIKYLGKFLATAMSIGAVFAAMNTMYASVGSRTREIGTLRVLGYRRRTILIGILIEGSFLALLGGVLGCLIALPMHGYTTGTISFESFSETVFQFRITPRLGAEGLIFSLLVGLIGSLLPALRAARLPVIAALKSV
ncbi:MAG: ABC transporter permease [Pedosphaera sp.]|nr:ABC transporter permease [Pedosphaera sp.]